MKQYIYEASVIGREEWPDGLLRLKGIEATTDPREADIFTVPGALAAVRWEHSLFPDRESLYRLPYFKGNEARHVLMDFSDQEPHYDLPCIFIRANARPFYLERDPNTLSWPWAAEDLSACIDPPADGFTYDVGFHGWICRGGPTARVHASRRESIQSCLDQGDLKCDFARYDDFTGYLSPPNPEYYRRRSEFRRSLKESRISLAGQSIGGVFPYRFWEALSAARIPLLIGSGFLFPWAEQIAYSDFILRLEQDQADQAGPLIADYLRRHSDAEILERGRLGRQAWDRYLRGDKWGELMAEAVLLKLGQYVQTRH